MRRRKEGGRGRRFEIGPRGEGKRRGKTKNEILKETGARNKENNFNNGNLTIFSKRKRKCDKMHFLPISFLAIVFNNKKTRQERFLSKTSDLNQGHFYLCSPGAN